MLLVDSKNKSGHNGWLRPGLIPFYWLENGWLHQGDAVNSGEFANRLGPLRSSQHRFMEDRQRINMSFLCLLLSLLLKVEHMGYTCLSTRNNSWIKQISSDKHQVVAWLL